MPDLILIIVAYFIGNISSGYLVGRLKNIDIRQYGSGNIGATNVLRTLGVLPSLMTLVLDVGKGVVAVLLAARYGSAPWIPALAGVFAIIGHIWPVFLGFRGGRGVATAFGVVLALMPMVALFIAVVWLFLVFVTRYISVGSIGAAASLPVGAWLLGESTQMIIISALLGILVIWRHRPNMQRLLAGEEFKIGQRVPAEKR
ncbi:MAG: glycerol-3-phosphate 1-O-acyltransferase PlsY [Limnochordia bacterium]|jgi:glycerol-3-phosphate acyltransferase PlsY